MFNLHRILGRYPVVVLSSFYKAYILTLFMIMYWLFISILTFFTHTLSKRFTIKYINVKFSTDYVELFTPKVGRSS